MTEIKVKGETLSLLPQKAVFWKRKSSLFIADLHLGKTSHFRKEGIGIPDSLIKEDYVRLESLLSRHEVRDVYLLGDLFHSEYNAEWDFVSDFIKSHSDKLFHLVLGNHDILNLEHYKHAGLEVHENFIELDPFKLIHEPPDTPLDDLFVLCGHIHPGIMIKGSGRQHFRLPCFFFSKEYAILPAFGTFTGLKTLKTSEGDCAFAVLKDKVIQINNYTLQN